MNITQKDTELDLLTDAATALTQAQTDVDSYARHARAEGATWSQIGAILGITKQRAQQRYGSVAAEIRTANAASKAAHEKTHAEDTAKLAEYAAKHATASIFLEATAPAEGTK